MSNLKDHIKNYIDFCIDKDSTLELYNIYKYWCINYPARLHEYVSNLSISSEIRKNILTMEFSYTYNSKTDESLTIYVPLGNENHGLYISIPVYIFLSENTKEEIDKYFENKKIQIENEIAEKEYKLLEQEIENMEKMLC